PYTRLHLRNQGILVIGSKLRVPGRGIQRVPYPTYNQARILGDLFTLEDNSNISQVHKALEKRRDLIRQRALDTAADLNTEDSRCGGEYVIASEDYATVSRGAAVRRTQTRIGSCRKQRYGHREPDYPFGPIRDVPDEEIKTNTTKNCGTDFNCFIVAGKKCEPAKVTRAMKQDVVGFDHTTNWFYELSSADKDYCTLYFSIQDVDVKISSEKLDEMHDANMTNDEISATLQKQQDEARDQKGLDALCRIAIIDLEDILKKVKADTMKISDWEDEECEGDYFET
ncbi:MAG: hypothetical protein ACE5FT_05870, partial [Candidatus Nanoarchaeia archaeon]